MTAWDDMNIIGNEFCGTAKLTDGVRIEHTHTHTHIAASGGKWSAAICDETIKIVCVKRQPPSRATQCAEVRERQRKHTHTHAHTRTHNRRRP